MKIIIIHNNNNKQICNTIGHLYIILVPLHIYYVYLSLYIYTHNIRIDRLFVLRPAAAEDVPVVHTQTCMNTQWNFLDDIQGDFVLNVTVGVIHYFICLETFLHV